MLEYLGAATNFSALGAVRDLSIHICQNLAAEDLPFLSNVPKLSLKISKNLASAISSLTNQCVNISKETEISDFNRSQF